MEYNDLREERGYIKGEISFVIFENSEEQFTIAKIKIHETNESYKEKDIDGKGHFSNLQEATVYTFYGQLIEHPKFGKQYDITAYETYVPNTTEGLIAYLSSDLFYGIGEKTATNIVNVLGEDAVQRIIEDPI